MIYYYYHHFHLILLIILLIYFYRYVVYSISLLSLLVGNFGKILQAKQEEKQSEQTDSV